MTVLAAVENVLAAISARGDDGVWISRVDDDSLLERARALDAVDRDRRAALPLFGMPFAVKDSFDVAGMETTAGCPAFAYRAEATAPPVARALDAGAVLVGKTNLDQFATGLVGTRSPYGVPRNPFDARFIPGGSSSGSAVAVAAGLVAFALGTDTAGSGRVPAALNGIVGLKPTRGTVSMRGCVPACRSLDCAALFAGNVPDAWRIFSVLRSFDPQDPYARAPGLTPGSPPAIGALPTTQLDFDGDAAAEELYARAVERVRELGREVVEIDFTPFAAAGRLLYQGPWLAERLEAAGELRANEPETLHPVTREVLAAADRFSAFDLFCAEHELEALRREVAPVWGRVEALLLPTTPTTYTVAAVQADPLGLNARLGTYTNFANLLDLAAIAVPAGVRPDGLPQGVALVGPAWSDARLARLGASLAVGTEPEVAFAPDGTPSSVGVVVVGAHLSGEPLNGVLLDLGGRLEEAVTTAPRYRLFALAGNGPARPGLVRVREGGVAIEAELWRLAPESLGQLLSGVGAPLAIGTVELADGREVKGFVCEAVGAEEGRDISAFGGWRAYRAAMNERHGR